MAGAPKGNQNARKHGLYSKKARVEIIVGPSTAVLRASAQGDGAAAIELQDPRRAIRYLEEVMDEIVRRMREATDEEFTRLANALSLATTAVFNGHRTVAYLTGEMTPVEDALKVLGALGFEED
jgi:hypothetical protein